MSDINPVKGGFNRTERKTLFKDQRKEFTADIELDILRDEINDLRFEDVDAGIDQSRKGLFGLGLLLEGLDPPLIIAHDHAVT